MFFYNSSVKEQKHLKFETTQFQVLPPQKTHHKHTENEPPASEHLADSILWVTSEGLEGPKTRLYIALKRYIALKSMAFFSENYWKWWNVILGPKNSDGMAMLYWGKGSNWIQCIQSIHHHSPNSPQVLAKEILLWIPLENYIPYHISIYIYDIFTYINGNCR